MQTTMVIDDNALAVAKSLAARERKSLGAMSALTRQVLQRRAATAGQEGLSGRDHLPADA
jgi:hypothetical protein